MRGQDYIYYLTVFWQEMDAWYKDKFQDMNSSTSRHVQSVRGVRQEITGVKKDVSDGSNYYQFVSSLTGAIPLHAVHLFVTQSGFVRICVCVCL